MTEEPTRGVTDARIHLMREADRAGELDPAIAAVLDRYNPTWRTDPLDTAWAEVYAEYKTWVQGYRRAPLHNDEGAAGLRSWLMAQHIGRKELGQGRIRLLEQLIGWDTPVVRSVNLDQAWVVIRGLRAAGVRGRRRETRVIDWMLSERAALHRADDKQAWSLGAAVGYWEQDWLLTVALFRLRHRRFPTAREPGGRWLQQVRARPEANGWLDAGLDQLGKWR